MFLVLLAVLALTACGSDDDTAPRPQSAALDGTYTPAPSLENGVQQFLEAEQRNDRLVSFALLAPSARTEYADAVSWADERQQTPAITTFRLEDSDDERQSAIVEHRPGLDPFVGLTPARERLTWRGERFEGGWLLEAEPERTLLLPPDDRARAAVTMWAEAVQACDRDRARTLQAVETLFGSPTAQLCRVPGNVVVAPLQTLVDGPATTDIVGQYGPDALSWARSVAISAPVALTVVVAPIGDEWKVLGLL